MKPLPPPGSRRSERKRADDKQRRSRLAVFVLTALILLGSGGTTAGFSNRHMLSCHPNDANVDPSDEVAATAQSGMVFLVSDGTGSMVKTSVQKSLYQFDDPDAQTRVFTFVRGEEVAAAIIKKAAERSAVIISTMADPSLREKMLRMCEMSNVPAVDLLGPPLDLLSSYLQKSPAGVPLYRGTSNTLSDSYYRRIEAVEFTLKADDGQSPWLLKEADVIIVGVSRTGKTPLSVVLSQTMGLKVANIPLVLECPPPPELLDDATIDARRVFCLTIAPTKLKQIRTTRLERRGVKEAEEKLGLLSGEAKSSYADRAYVLKDLKKAHELTERCGWTRIDVTGRAVEETASSISEMMNERFEQIFLTKLNN